MGLSEIISIDRILVDRSVASKKRSIEEIAHLLERGAGGVSREDIINGLATREKLGSTALGCGVAIPHGRIIGIRETVGAFLRLRRPVDYDSRDALPVDLIFGLLVPQEATDEHLGYLATVAEKFSDDVFVSAIRQATDRAEIHALLVA